MLSQDFAQLVLAKQASIAVDSIDLHHFPHGQRRDELVQSDAGDCSAELLMLVEA